MNYDITIGIPTFNRSHCLARAINSALAQVNVRVEIIVCDNNSSDATALVMDEYKYIENVKYVKNSFNIGPTANYNQCLNLATGEYFMVLGDDDWISQEYCMVLIDSLKNTEAIFLGKCLAVSSSGEIISESSTLPFNVAGSEFIEGFITKRTEFKEFISRSTGH